MSRDARQSLVFGGDRDTLIEVSAVLSGLTPQGAPGCYGCPMHGCTRTKRRGSESRQTLATHLLADHYATVKSAAAVAARMGVHAAESKACPFDSQHVEPSPGVHARSLCLPEHQCACVVQYFNEVDPDYSL